MRLMHLSHVTECQPGGMERRTGLHVSWALLAFYPDNAEVYREVAASIDLLRGDAPFAYLVANKHSDFPNGWWEQSKERDYYAPLPKRQLQHGVWFGAPYFEEPTETTLMSVGRGDILPYVWTLHDDWHQILCLPTAKSLEAIDEIVASSRSTAEALARLLADGGFVATCIDFHLFQIRAIDARYKSFFSNVP